MSSSCNVAHLPGNIIHPEYALSQTWIGLYYFNPLDISYLRKLEYTQQDVELMLGGDLITTAQVHPAVGGWPLIAKTPDAEYTLCYLPPSYRRPIAILEHQRVSFGYLADDRTWPPLPERVFWKKIARMWLGCIHHVLAITADEVRTKQHDGCNITTTSPERLPRGLRLCGIDTLLSLVQTWRIFKDLNGELELPELPDTFSCGDGHVPPPNL